MFHVQLERIRKRMDVKKRGLQNMSETVRPPTPATNRRGSGQMGRVVFCGVFFAGGSCQDFLICWQVPDMKVSVK